MWGHIKSIVYGHPVKNDDELFRNLIKDAWLKSGLKRYVNVDLRDNNIIELVINVDGLPISKPGIKQLWVNSYKVHCKKGS